MTRACPPRLSASSPAPRAQIVVTFPLKCLVIFRSDSRRICSCCSLPCFPSPRAEGTVSSPGWGWGEGEGAGFLTPFLPSPSVMWVDARLRKARGDPLSFTLPPHPPPSFLSLLLFSSGIQELVFPSPEGYRGCFPTLVMGLEVAPSWWEKLKFCLPLPATHPALSVLAV